MTSPCILELQYYHLSLSRMILLRQYHQHRIAALLLAKHADYNSLEKKKKKETLQTSRRFSSIQGEKNQEKKKKQKRNQTGEVEGKEEMKDGESS